MMYRGTDFRSDNRSNAEWDVMVELQHRGLLKECSTQLPVTLDIEQDRVHGTVIDFYFYHPHFLAVYLDGDRVHRSTHSLRRDTLITAALEKRGFTVKRYPYTPPLTKTRRTEIVDDIQRLLKVGEA